jgi:CheY-like chemotaxis protein
LLCWPWFVGRVFSRLVDLAHYSHEIAQWPKGSDHVLRQTVLIVDDEPSILDFLSEALQWEGYTVLTAGDGDALRLARTFQPNVILLDLVMPGMDGRELSRRLRDDRVTADIPIILMSANDCMHLQVEEIPVNDHLAKPFRLQVLYDTVASWC